MLTEDAQLGFARGMNDSAPPWELKQDECLYLRNVRVTADGLAEVRRGTRRTHATALNSGAQGYGATQFTLADGTVQWVVFVGTKMYYSIDEGLNWTEGASGLRADYWSLVTMRVGSTNYLLCANGDTASYKWTGAAWSAISNIPNGAKLLAVHNERLWAYVSGVTGYASKIADPETWTAPDGLVLNFHTHDGDDIITGLFSVGSLLVVFKRNSTAYTAGFGNSDIVVRTGAQGLFRDVGCVGFRTIAAVGGGGVMWCSERGFELWYPSQAAPTLVSQNVQRFTDTLAWDRLLAVPGLPCAVYWPVAKTYECAVPWFSSVENDIVFVYHLPELKKPGAVSLIERTSEPIDSLYADNPHSWPVVSPYDGAGLDGYLDHSAVNALSNGSIDEDGYFDVVPATEYGFQFYEYRDETVTEGYLRRRKGAYDCAAMFIADVAGLPNSMLAVGWDGFVRRLEIGRYDNVASDGSGTVPVRAQVRLRPFYFRNRFQLKRIRSLRLQVAPSPEAEWLVQLTAGVASSQERQNRTDAWITAYVRADGGNQAYSPGLQTLLGVDFGRQSLQRTDVYVPPTTAPTAAQRSTLARPGLKCAAAWIDLFTGLGAGGAMPDLYENPAYDSEIMLASTDPGLRFVGAESFASPMAARP